MGQFNYSAYAMAIKGLTELPDELIRTQEKYQSSITAKRQQIESVTKRQIDELGKAERVAFQQFDDVAREYRVLFSVPVSRPTLVPSPLSIKDAVAAQNIYAMRLKSVFDTVKQEAVEKKKQQIEAAKAEQRRQAALKAAEEEQLRRQEEEAQRLKEEAYRKELERANRSTLQKLIDFLTGQ